MVLSTENEVVTARDHALQHLSLGDSLVISFLHAPVLRGGSDPAEVDTSFIPSSFFIVDPKKRMQVAEMRSNSLRHATLHGLF